MQPEDQTYLSGSTFQMRLISFTEHGRTKPILSRKFPKNQTVTTGGNLTLECREIVSVSLTDYRWIRWYKVPPNHTKLEFKDRPATNSSKYFLYDLKYYSAFKDGSEYGVKLMLRNVTEKDSGLYTCLVSNHLGFTSRSAFVTVADSGWWYGAYCTLPPPEPLNLLYNFTGFQRGRDW